ncbi:MAG: hypothetical protein ACQETV_03860 [Actinomycetota bacterium]
MRASTIEPAEPGDTPSWRARAVRATVLAALVVAAVAGVGAVLGEGERPEVVAAPTVDGAELRELSDGTPVWATRVDGEAHVLDARAPARGDSSVSGLLALCDRGDDPALIERASGWVWTLEGAPTNPPATLTGQADPDDDQPGLAGFAVTEAAGHQLRLGDRAAPDVGATSVPSSPRCRGELTAPPLPSDRADVDELAGLDAAVVTVDGVVEQQGDDAWMCERPDGVDPDADDATVPVCDRDAATPVDGAAWPLALDDPELAVARVGEMWVEVADGDVTAVRLPPEIDLVAGPTGGEVTVTGRVASVPSDQTLPFLPWANAPDRDDIVASIRAPEVTDGVDDPGPRFPPLRMVGLALADEADITDVEGDPVAVDDVGEAILDGRLRGRAELTVDRVSGEATTIEMR